MPAVAAERTVTAASSVTLDALDGDTDQAYSLLLDGTLATGGATRRVTLRPNASTAGTRGLTTDNYVAGDGTNPVANSIFSAPASTGIPIANSWTNATALLVTGTLHAHTGARRIWLGDYTENDSTQTTYLARGTSSGVWTDTAANLTSAVIDFGGGTFTGRIVVVPYGSGSGAGSTGATGAAGPAGPAGPNGADGQPRQLQDEGTDLPVRSKVDIVGAGIEAHDDAANNRSVITVDAAPGSGGTTSTSPASSTVSLSAADRSENAANAEQIAFWLRFGVGVMLVMLVGPIVRRIWTP